PSFRESGLPSGHARQPRARPWRGFASRLHPAWLADRRGVARVSRGSGLSPDRWSHPGTRWADADRLDHLVASGPGGVGCHTVFYLRRRLRPDNPTDLRPEERTAGRGAPGCVGNASRNRAAHFALELAHRLAVASAPPAGASRPLDQPVAV